MSGTPTLRLLLTSILLLVVVPAQAITIDIDYSYDSTNFFGAGNPSGSAAGLAAKASLEAAAGFFSDLLDDTFSAIQTPPDYHSSAFNSVVEWSWTMTFTNPSTGTTAARVDQTIAADEYRIYVGARSLSGNTAGQGGTGGFSSGATVSGDGRFLPSEIDEINQIDEDFSNAVENRGETSGFARWGGALAFDNDGSSTWHYDHTTAPIGGTTDLYSVAIHELAHSLGFGASSEWQSLVSGSNFIGSASMSEYGGIVPLSADLAHWSNGTTSTVLGSATSQEAAMDPSLTNGTRKLLTDLDAAALTDIGWTVVAPPGVDGDYNGDGVVDAADYTVWRDNLGTSTTLPNDPTPGSVTEGDFTLWKANFGMTASSGSGAIGGTAVVPEPTSLVLLIMGWLAACSVRRR